MFIRLTAISPEDPTALSAPVWVDAKRIVAMVRPPAVKGKQFTVLILEQSVSYTVLEDAAQIIASMPQECRCQSGITSKDSTGDTKTLT